ncbi:MAG: hypothetical protein WC729_07385 [Sphingomonas sp.]|jgi:hypothetical protein|uniref:hypothetical protein n=1 Tax=Sphingomonas sp. TaxID=28214 RepID=UPI0035630B84
MVDPTAFRPHSADDLNQAAPVPAAISPVIAPVPACSANNRWRGIRPSINTINRHVESNITGAEKNSAEKQVITGPRDRFGSSTDLRLKESGTAA